MNASLLAACSLFLCAGASAQFTSSFEPPVEASSSGVSIAGQDAWFTPDVAGTIGQFAMTYDANIHGFAANPTGANNFLVGRSEGVPAFARAQRNTDFSTADTWTASWDMAVLFNGAAPSAANLGSFSQQPLGTAFWQSLYNWTDNANPTAWNCAFLPFDAAGMQFAQPGVTPDPAFGNLLPNHWYRVSGSWSFTSNAVTSVSITDLSTGATTTVEPTGWFLGGGAAGGLPRPTAVRFFAGGNLGNTVAVDNVVLAQGGGGPACDPDFNCDGNPDQDDVACIINVVAGNPGCECQDPDFNQDGNVDQDDVAALINVVAGGNCP